MKAKDSTVNFLEKEITSLEEQKMQFATHFDSQISNIKNTIQYVNDIANGNVFNVSMPLTAPKLDAEALTEQLPSEPARSTGPRKESPGFKTLTPFGREGSRTSKVLEIMYRTKQPLSVNELSRLLGNQYTAQNVSATCSGLVTEKKLKVIKDFLKTDSLYRYTLTDTYREMLNRRLEQSNTSSEPIIGSETEKAEPQVKKRAAKRTKKWKKENVGISDWVKEFLNDKLGRQASLEDIYSFVRADYPKLKKTNLKKTLDTLITRGYDVQRYNLRGVWFYKANSVLASSGRKYKHLQN